MTLVVDWLLIGLALAIQAAPLVDGPGVRRTGRIFSNCTIIVSFSSSRDVCQVLRKPRKQFVHEEFVLDKDLRRSLKTTGSTTGRNVLAKAPEEHARHQPTQDGSGLWVL